MTPARPRVRFDHVQIAVLDLDAAASRLRHEHGLEALPGGRHPGRGTANMIVPLGDDYLELIAVVDPAETALVKTSQRVTRAVDRGETFAAWAVATDDLDAMRAYLRRQGFDLPAVTPGARRRPDGVQLAWRMQELVRDAVRSPLPFLIEWKLAPELYPGAAPAAHRGRVRRVAGVRLADPDPDAVAPKLRAVLDDDVRFTVERGEPGVVGIALDTVDGEVELT